MDPQIKSQLRQTITVAPVTGRNEFGQPTYGAPVVYPCRIRDLQKAIEDRNGQQVVAAVEILTEAVIGLEDRIWLPGKDVNDPNQSQTPLNRLTLVDEFGSTVGCRTWL